MILCGCSSYRELGKNIGQLAPQVSFATVVVYDKNRTLSLLLLRELSCRALVDECMTAPRGALPTRLLLGDHSDSRVEAALHARLKQQRHLHHGCPRRRLQCTHMLQPSGHARTHEPP